jgi:hypothetical protein
MDVQLRGDARWIGFGLTPVERSRGSDVQRPFDTPPLVLSGEMLGADGTSIHVELVPVGNAPFLRRVTFPIGEPRARR